MKKTFISLFIILTIAAGLRFYQLGSVPPSPDWDEAALGYNAYSILKTGRDEYGNFLPLSIRSFDDYKPPLYVYITVPSVALFGLSVWSTRLPSAVMGVLAVLGVFFLVRELLRDRKNDTIPLLSSFLLAISPWSIQFSRVAFEANTGVTVNIWAVTAFLAGLKKRIFLPIAAVLFALGMYAYHSERVFLPLLIIILAVVFRRELFVKEHTKSIILSIVLGVLVTAPLVPVVFNQTALLRLQGTSSFTDQTGLLARDITKLEQDQKAGDRIGQLLDNRRIVYAKTVVAGYLSHFSFKWLFLTGDNQRHHAPDMGLLYVWELPFLLYGIYRVLKYRKGPVSAVLVGWLLISPVAAAPTTGLPHAVRTLVFLPVFQVFTAVGVAEAFWISRKYLSVRKRLLWYAVAAVVGLLAVFNVAFYLDMYFVQQNPEVSQYWQYGYKNAVAYTEKVKAKYQKIVVSTKLEQSYIFFLFYTNYDPVKYLAAGGTQSGGFAAANDHFDKYEFRPLDWEHEVRDGTILYVGDPKDMPHGNVMIFKFLDGTPAIEMADSVSTP
jgi:4-amino-4-deoxy-L-arabinose transferase-like glycosyltransferase